MVANEEEVILPAPTLDLVKPIELKDIGFLQKQPTYVNCPSCLSESLSVVRLEVVTIWQKFLKITNLRKTSESRCDINHYCSICGCYIGRYVSVGWVERLISAKARRKAALDDMSLKSEPTDCALESQKYRERFKARKQKENDKNEENK